MTDIWSKEKRSEVMSRIRGRDTRPERVVRSLLHRLGFRFTVNGRRNRQLPGKPDLVLPRHRCVVYVHGCFWHGHAGCKGFRLPGSNVEFWSAKIAGNKARDRRSLRAVRALGWKALVVWECETGTLARIARLRDRLQREFRPETGPRAVTRRPGAASPPAAVPLAAEEPAVYRIRRGSGPARSC
jgi:DNA mismatch endonuclease (patch repair protein)